MVNIKELPYKTIDAIRAYGCFIIVATSNKKLTKFY